MLWASHCKRKPETNASRVCAPLNGVCRLGFRDVWCSASLALAGILNVSGQGLAGWGLQGVSAYGLAGYGFFLAAIGQGSRGFWRA